MPQLLPGEEQNDVIKCTLAQSMIEDRYPPEAWVQVYTDGSATNAVYDGGAGVMITTPEGRKIESGIPTGLHCTNYTAEKQAIMHALDKLDESLTECSQVVILTDARSVLEALAGEKEPELRRRINRFCQEHQRVAMQWVPAHCGIPGNEIADQLAKSGANEMQHDRSISFVEKKAMIKSFFRTTPKADALHSLERWQQVIVLRLRTGHSRLKAHLSKKLHVVGSPNCTCGDEETPEHVLQHCHLYHRQRLKVWPEPTEIQTKIYGSKRDLENTTKFIEEIGLTV